MSDTDHLGREINAGNVLTTLRQLSGECTGATSNLKCVFAIRREMLQEGTVIVIVCSPAFVVEECESIEVCLDGGHVAFKNNPQISQS